MALLLPLIQLFIFNGHNQQHNWKNGLQPGKLHKQRIN